MVRIMALTFLALGWAFYEMSGGADFAPPEVVPAPRIAYAAPDPVEERAPSWLGAAAAAGTPAATPTEGGDGLLIPAALDAPPEPALVAVAAPPEPALERRVVTGGRVNMRTGPGTEHAVTTTLSRGAPVEVLAVEGRWARVRGEGFEGWMALGLLGAAG